MKIRKTILKKIMETGRLDTLKYRYTINEPLHLIERREINNLYQAVKYFNLDGTESR